MAITYSIPKNYEVYRSIANNMLGLQRVTPKKTTQLTSPIFTEVYSAICFGKTVVAGRSPMYENLFRLTDLNGEELCATPFIDCILGASAILIKTVSVYPEHGNKLCWALLDSEFNIIKMLPPGIEPSARRKGFEKYLEIGRNNFVLCHQTGFDVGRDLPMYDIYKLYFNGDISKEDIVKEVPAQSINTAQVIRFMELSTYDILLSNDESHLEILEHKTGRAVRSSKKLGGLTVLLPSIQNILGGMTDLPCKSVLALLDLLDQLKSHTYVGFLALIIKELASQKFSSPAERLEAIKHNLVDTNWVKLAPVIHEEYSLKVMAIKEIIVVLLKQSEPTSHKKVVECLIGAIEHLPDGVSQEVAKLTAHQNYEQSAYINILKSVDIIGELKASNLNIPEDTQIMGMSLSDFKEWTFQNVLELRLNLGVAGVNHTTCLPLILCNGFCYVQKPKHGKRAGAPTKSSARAMFLI